MQPKIDHLMSNDPFNQFQFRTTIEYDFDESKWSYFEFGFYKRNIKDNQWINNDHSLMHDPVYPIMNDRLVVVKNWIQNKYIFSTFSSNWPYSVIVNQDQGSCANKPFSDLVSGRSTEP